VADDERCPVCGHRKAAWTLEFKRTRLFQLGAEEVARDEEAQVEVLRRAAGKGAPFCAECEAARARQDAESQPGEAVG
jgi:hypothetical protein